MNSASSTMFVTAPTATFPILTSVLPLPSKIDAFGAPPMLTNAAKAGALDYLAVISTLFVILGFLMIFRNTLQGLGYSTMAVISGVGELIGRSFGGWLALHGLGFLGISLANPIAWGFALCYCAFMVTRMLRKEDKQAEK